MNLPQILAPRPQSPYETPQFLGWLDLVKRYIDASPRIQAFDVVAATSGTSLTLASSIISYAQMVAISFSGISTNGTSQQIIQLNGETSGYIGAGTSGSNGASPAVVNSTAGMALNSTSVAAQLQSGLAILHLLDSSTNLWTYQYTGARDNAVFCSGAGHKALTTTLSSIVLTMANGTDAFDAGSIKVTVFGWA